MTTTARITDRVPLTTRSRTADGRLRGKAAMTRTGVFEYLDSELGLGDAGKTIRVFRGDDSVFHADTIASLSGATITDGHPDEFVSPDNWHDFSVGNVVGLPAKIDDTRLGADIIIGRKSAIDTIESGKAELSIAATMRLERAGDGESGYDYRSVGALDINHVAVVKQGRAGSGVRIFDKRGNLTMNADELKSTIQAALADALKSSDGNKPPAVDVNALTASITTAISPVIDSVKKLTEDAVKREQEAQVADAKRKAEEEAKKFESEIVKRERGRAKILADALPMIPADKREEAESLDTKALMLLAIGDAVKVPDGASDDYVAGIFDSIKRERAAANNGSVTVGGLPTGSPVDKARENYVSTLQDAWKMGGKPANTNGAGGGAGA